MDNLQNSLQNKPKNSHNVNQGQDRKPVLPVNQNFSFTYLKE